MSLRKLILALALVLISTLQMSARAETATTTPKKKAPAKVPKITETFAPEAPGIVVDDAFANPAANGHQKILDSLNSLGKGDTVKMWMFSMSDPDIITALKNADSREVNITIIFNGAMFEGDDAKIPQELKTGTQITVLRATPEFSITHAKTFIVNSAKDGQYVWIMSLNTTQNFPNQADFAVRTSDAAVLSDLNNLFATDVSNSANKSDATSPITSPNLIVSPVNSLDRLLALINTATVSIDMTVENLAYSLPTTQSPDSFTQIVDALKAKIQNGIKVRVITPSCDMNPSNPGFNLTALAALNKVRAGVGRVMPYPGSETTPYMHQKIIIIDGQRFYVGSENFSSNSLTKAREIGVIAKVSGPDDIIIGDFNTEWGNTTVPPASIPKNCDAFGGKGKTTNSEKISKETDRQ
jgi:cardiolipin synthase A/B